MPRYVLPVAVIRQMHANMQHLEDLSPPQEFKERDHTLLYSVLAKMGISGSRDSNAKITPSNQPFTVGLEAPDAVNAQIVSAINSAISQLRKGNYDYNGITAESFVRANPTVVKKADFELPLNMAMVDKLIAKYKSSPKPTVINDREVDFNTALSWALGGVRITDSIITKTSDNNYLLTLNAEQKKTFDRNISIKSAPSQPMQQSVVSAPAIDPMMKNTYSVGPNNLGITAIEIDPQNRTCTLINYKEVSGGVIIADSSFQEGLNRLFGYTSNPASSTSVNANNNQGSVIATYPISGDDALKRVGHVLANNPQSASQIPQDFFKQVDNLFNTRFAAQANKFVPKVNNNFVQDTKGRVQEALPPPQGLLSKLKTEFESKHWDTKGIAFIGKKTPDHIKEIRGLLARTPKTPQEAQQQLSIVQEALDRAVHKESPRRHPEVRTFYENKLAEVNNALGETVRNTAKRGMGS